MKLEDLSKEQLLEEIKKLKKRKKFGLVWENKPEKVVEKCKTELPVLEEIKEREIYKKSDLSFNFLIEGDNYHALSVLNYTHRRKIDVIYIDPPYNTGAKDWKYNNNFVDINDNWRHSKWIQMMSHRLKSSRSLLSKSGFIICAIDKHELFSLGLLMDEIFGENNRLGIITVVHKPEGRNQEKFFGTSNEFMLVYARDIRYASFNKIALDEEQKNRFTEQDELGYYRLKNFIRLTDGKYSLRENKPHFFYPIYVSNNLKEFSVIEKEGYTAVYPITEKGIERTWKTTKNTFAKLVNKGNIVAKKEDGHISIYEKLREDQVIKTHWIKKEYHGYHFGTKLIQDILGSKKFDFPKSLYLIKDVLKLVSKKDSVILDFFAGSGTTGHAVLELNKEDGGNRKFILCTNNENGIAEEVCYPRVKSVIEGYSDVEGISANLKYFKTSFIPKSIVSDDTRTNIVKKSTEMICIKEGTFEELFVSEGFKIFKNGTHTTAILFNLDCLDELKEKIQSVKLPSSIYVFSLSNDTYDKDFEDLSVEHELCPIPESILEVYRKLFKD